MKTKNFICKFGLVLFGLCFVSACTVRIPFPKKVCTVVEVVNNIPQINVENVEKFLNDLKLSPFWKVEKEIGSNYFRADARSISSSDPFLKPNPNMFLFEFLLAENPVLPESYTILNRYVDGSMLDSYSGFSSFSATILFQKPRGYDMNFYSYNGKVKLDVYDLFENKIGNNSSSRLVLKLSDKHDIYLILQENGKDPKRKATFAKLPKLVKSLAGMVSLPADYYVKQRYRDFFKIFFPQSDKDIEVRRFPGIQDCDTFYGYFKSKKGVNYEGVNIKISHPVYCNGECTGSRQQKAEYLGYPYHENDFLFFLIERNAVYVHGDYNKNFGIFSGKESFEAKVEILNNQNEVLFEGKDSFKGWQR